MKTGHAVMALKEKGAIQITEDKVLEIPMIWAEGMIGAIPVFETRAAAEKYAENTYGIVGIKIPETGEER